MNNHIAQFLGNVNPPTPIIRYGNLSSGGLSNFIANIVRLLTVIAGIYVLFNIIIAGYGFISAGGDPKKIADSWAKIYQSMLGLIVVAGALILAGLIGYFVYGSPTTILQIVIYGPN